MSAILYTRYVIHATNKYRQCQDMSTILHTSTDRMQRHVNHTTNKSRKRAKIVLAANCFRTLETTFQLILMKFGDAFILTFDDKTNYEHIY